jgi:hypothetical protein
MRQGSPIDYFLNNEKGINLLQFIFLTSFAFDNDTLTVGKIGKDLIGETKRNGEVIRFKIIENNYEDNHFRWNKGELNLDYPLILQLGKKHIRMFSSEKIRQRLREEAENIQSSPDKTRSAIKYRFVESVVADINIGEWEGYSDAWTRTNGSKDKRKSSPCIDDSCDVNIN